MAQQTIVEGIPTWMIHILEGNYAEISEEESEELDQINEYLEGYNYVAPVTEEHNGDHCMVVYFGAKAYGNHEGGELTDIIVERVPQPNMNVEGNN